MSGYTLLAKFNDETEKEVQLTEDMIINHNNNYTKSIISNKCISCDNSKIDIIIDKYLYNFRKSQRAFCFS